MDPIRYQNTRKKYLDKTRLRDLAITTLLLGTGIRISECVGLDIQDVNFKDNSIKITRKRWKRTDRIF